MASIFRLVEGHCSCKGCASRIYKCAQRLPGVKSVEVERIQDENGNYGITLIVKGRLDPENFIIGVESKTQRRFQLVSESEVCQPQNINVKDWKKLNQLADNNLGKALRLTELVNECEFLKAQVDAARARQNELGRRKLNTLNRVLPTTSLNQRSQGSKTKKEDESEVLYGKLARQEIKVDDFVHNLKQLQFNKHKQLFTA